METTQNLFGFEQIEASTESNSTLIFEEITDTDSTDGVFNFLSILYEKIQEEFDKLLDGDSDKKLFLEHWQEYLPFKHKGRHAREN